MGPVLRDEFEAKLAQRDFNVVTAPVDVDITGDNETQRIEGDVSGKTVARVGLISHIGGHKFAGNVIVYIPQGYEVQGGGVHPLAGCGIWYGRVEPKHVEGLVEETVLRGRVVEDMFRGGIDANRRILRI